MSVTFYGTVVSIESSGPPEIEPPSEPSGEGGTGGLEPTPKGDLVSMLALRAMRDLMPGYYRVSAMSPAGAFALGAKTVQESQQDYGIATGGAVATQGQGATEQGNAPPRVSVREGEVPEEPQLWMHVHIRLDAPHAGELQVNAPESQVAGMLQVDGRARVTLSSN